MTFRETLELINADILNVNKCCSDFSGKSLRWTRRLSLMATPPVMCCMLFRFSQWAFSKRIFWLADFISWINYVVHKAVLCPGAKVGPGLYIPHPIGVMLHANAGERLTLFAHAMVCSDKFIIRKRTVTADCPTLGDDVIVGAHAAVVGPVTIGDGSTVGLGLGLTTSIPPKMVTVPMPSRVVSLYPVGEEEREMALADSKGSFQS